VGKLTRRACRLHFTSLKRGSGSGTKGRARGPEGAASADGRDVSKSAWNEDDDDDAEAFLHLCLPAPARGDGDETEQDADGDERGARYDYAKIWQIRQVSTSNSVYILRPQSQSQPESGEPRDDGEGGAGRVGGAAAGVEVIAQVGNVMECVEVKLPESDGEGELGRAVAVEKESKSVGPGTSTGSAQGKGKSKVDWHERLGRQRKG